MFRSDTLQLNDVLIGNNAFFTKRGSRILMRAIREVNDQIHRYVNPDDWDNDWNQYNDWDDSHSWDNHA